MNILDMITGAQGGRAVDQIAAQFGLPPEQAKSAIAVLVPALAAGLQRNAATHEGSNQLANALGRGSHETYLEQPDRLTEPTTTADGNAILGHLFGSKEVSRQVATKASQQTGIDPAILKKMLPIVAALAMASLAKQTKAAPGGVKAGGLGAVLGGLIDRDRDGSIADDVAGMLGGLLKGRA